MLNPAWLFVLAAVIAVLGILFFFKQMMASIQSSFREGQIINRQAIQKEQTNFFIKVALAEAIPIVFIVVGFAQIDPLGDTIVNIFLPMIIILGTLVFALVQVLRIRNDTLGYGEISAETKNMINTLIFIGIALMSAIPTISIVALFIMSS